MGFCIRTFLSPRDLRHESMYAGYICPQTLNLDLTFLTREGLRQRKWVNYLAVYVALGFVANELSLFLICRPLSNYWAVPTPYGQSKR